MSPSRFDSWLATTVVRVTSSGLFDFGSVTKGYGVRLISNKNLWFKKGLILKIGVLLCRRPVSMTGSTRMRHVSLRPVSLVMITLTMGTASAQFPILINRGINLKISGIYVAVLLE